MTEHLFNMNINMVRKQCNTPTLQCDNSEPICKNETLEPCIRGARKIANNPEHRQLIKEILTSQHK